MTFLKLIFFLGISWSTMALIFDHRERIRFDRANHRITKVIASGHPDLRSACIDLMNSDALILKSTERAEKAKRICEWEFGI